MIAIVKKYWRPFIRIASIFSAMIVAFFLSAVFVVLIILNRGLPSVESLKHYEPKETSQVFSVNGEVIGEFFEERRYVVSEVPEHVKDAFIAAEDSGFFRHSGVDFFGIARAAYKNFLAGGKRQGASTITQQVARGFLLSPEKSWTRKIKEAILAWQIENALSKEEILHLYLNHIYLGSGAYGVAAAAQVYFGKSLDEISIAEAAILAGLPKAPNRYSPVRNPERVKRRQLYVLKQMYKSGFIAEEDYNTSIHEDVLVKRPRDLNKEISPYFVEYVRQYVMNKYGSDNILHGGYKIYTSLDADMDRYAQNALRKGLSDLEKRQGYAGPIQRLKGEQMNDYFKMRAAEEGDEDVQAGELEVSAKEAKEAGAIRMSPPPPLEAGDWLEGIVKKIDDEKKEALVEYEPGFFARLILDDLKWAHNRLDPEDEEGVVRSVGKISDVLHVGDVIPMSVKSKPATAGPEVAIDPKNPADIKPIEAQLEQLTDVEGAVYAMDPHSGEVRSMVGGYDFNRSQFNRAFQARRQPGSAFKPIIYAAGLDLGFTPASLLQDSPITFENASDQEKWRPSNYDQKFLGDVTLRTSLLMSRNITTIRLLNEVGIDNAILYSKRLGIESPLTRDFTLALGSSIVTLPEIVQPYVVFANQGYRKAPVTVLKVVDRNGQILEESSGEDYTASEWDQLNEAVTELKKETAAIELTKEALKGKDKSDQMSFLQDGSGGKDADKQRKMNTTPLKPGQVLNTETSFLMATLLKENVLYGTGVKAKELNRPASGKTGTTDENKDAWFIGFTPDLVAGVWVGYDDLRVLGRQETGGRAAVPIWLDFMIRAVDPYPKNDFPVPENIEFVKIDPKTGGLASPKSKNGIFEAFVKGTAPTTERRPNVNELDLYQLEQ